MKKIILIGLLFLELNAMAQTKPFPANVTYPYGLTAAGASIDAESSYTTWKTNFIDPCTNGRYRVKFDNPNETVSEGIGYGMLLTAYKADQTVFDGLWNYYKDNRNGNGVMNWKINGCSGTIGSNGATDAELDVAMALIVADYQWGSAGTINYKNDAKALIAAIKAHEIEASTKVLKPGDAFGGSNLTNPSYFAPGYYRAFGNYTNDTVFWNSVSDVAYTIINNNLTTNNAVGGLVSDWCKATGEYSSDASGYDSQGKNYRYDAARTPWRIAVDYLWHGTANAKTYCKKSSDFVKNTLSGSANIKDGYKQDGTVVGLYHNATFVGAFAAAATAGENQTHLNNSYNDLKGLNEPNSYFNHTLKTLYQFLLTGNFYLPANATSATLANTSFETNPFAVALYPNPNSGVFNIQAPTGALATVYTSLGKAIYTKRITKNDTELSLTGQISGLYFVKIENEGKTVTKKMIVE